MNQVSAKTLLLRAIVKGVIVYFGALVLGFLPDTAHAVSSMPRASSEIEGGASHWAMKARINGVPSRIQRDRR